MDLPRIIGIKNLQILHSWADTAYGIHDDFKGHTGGTASLGHGIIQHVSSKQKLNTKSSTEVEVVGASDYLPWILWMKWFLQEQGYGLKCTYLYQDNKSTIRLIKNGKRSSRQKTRNINIR